MFKSNALDGDVTAHLSDNSIIDLGSRETVEIAELVNEDGVSVIMRHPGKEFDIFKKLSAIVLFGTIDSPTEDNSLNIFSF